MTHDSVTCLIVVQIVDVRANFDESFENYAPTVDKNTIVQGCDVLFFFLECRIFEDASIFVVCITVERFCRVNLHVPSQGKHPLLKVLFPRGGGYSDPFHCIRKR